MKYYKQRSVPSLISPRRIIYTGRIYVTTSSIGLSISLTESPRTLFSGASKEPYNTFAKYNWKAVEGLATI